jgi:hypothetical protein
VSHTSRALTGVRNSGATLSSERHAHESAIGVRDGGPVDCRNGRDRVLSDLPQYCGTENQPCVSMPPFRRAAAERSSNSPRSWDSPCTMS